MGGVCTVALCAAAATNASAARLDPIPASQPSVFDGTVMWAWVLSKTSGGNLDKIASQARKAGVKTIIFKAADAGNEWPQYSRALIDGLHQRGIKVCGYHFVYGRIALTEAKLSARIARKGDCLLIDAEGQYEGRYTAAQQYMTALRNRIGDDYPVGLAPFPYIHFHGAFPYSVFLGPRGAQFDLPQMYWRDIGTTVDQVFASTYLYHRLYKRAVYPLGQAYYGPPNSEVARFRQLAQAYGATGVSWWVWQFAGPNFKAIGQQLGPAKNAQVKDRWPTLRRTFKGDYVLWAQQHLIAAGQAVKADGIYSTAMVSAVEAFQGQNGLPVTGAIDSATWRALLARDPAKVSWKKRNPAFVTPRSAASSTRRSEIAGKPGG